MLLGPGVLSTLRPSMAFCSSSRLVNLRLVTVAKLAATSTLSITTEYEGSGNRLELSLQALSQGFSFLGFSERGTPPPPSPGEWPMEVREWRLLSLVWSSYKAIDFRNQRIPACCSTGYSCTGRVDVGARGFWRRFMFRIIELLDFFHRPMWNKAKRLTLQRFESGLCFVLQVKKCGGGGPCLRLAHSKGPDGLGLLSINV